MIKAKGTLLLLLAALIWGMAFVAQTSAADKIGAFTFNASRSIICNSPDLVEIGMNAGKEIFGDQCVLGSQPYLAGDSAAYYFQLVKGLRIVFFAKKHGDDNYPLHNPKFNFDEDIFPYAIATLYNLIISL